MPGFSSRSEAQLSGCHDDLQSLFREVVKVYDCTIDGGYRDAERQLELYRAGRSKLKSGKHNKIPSLAVDVAPYPVIWPDQQPTVELQIAAMKRFVHFAGYVKRVGEELGIVIRWGGDWDGDGDFSDQRFHDLPHYELIMEE